MEQVVEEMRTSSIIRWSKTDWAEVIEPEFNKEERTQLYVSVDMWLGELFGVL